MVSPFDMGKNLGANIMRRIAVGAHLSVHWLLSLWNVQTIESIPAWSAVSSLSANTRKSFLQTSGLERTLQRRLRANSGEIWVGWAFQMNWMGHMAESINFLAPRKKITLLERSLSTVPLVPVSTKLVQSISSSNTDWYRSWYVLQYVIEIWSSEG